MAELATRITKAQHIGARVRQEDAVAFHASQSDEPSLALLSDGMGGHEDGDLASRMIVGEAFRELFLAAGRPTAFARRSGLVFDTALQAANRRLSESIDGNLISSEAGGTLICASVQDGRLRWLSVGDSVLYLFRAGCLQILNDIHSLGAQLDRMAAAHKLPAADAESHPDRACLTSAVTGGPITKVDCPEEGIELQDGDIVVLASDGVETMKPAQLEAIIAELADARDDIAAGLVDGVRAAGGPNQDNISVIVIEIGMLSAARNLGARPIPVSRARRWPLWLRRIGA
ncbi:MAG: protein phosphatase 2C domain-containing protein [Pseudomonadota bacterium]